MAKTTRVSSLLASQGPHTGYICSPPQVFIMTDLRRSDITDIRRRLGVPRRKRASPLCKCSRWEASREGSVKNFNLIADPKVYEREPKELWEDG